VKNHAPCTQWADKVAARHSKDLTSSERAELEKHAQSCIACANALKDYDAIITQIRALVESEPILPLSPRLLDLREGITVGKLPSMMYAPGMRKEVAHFFVLVVLIVLVVGASFLIIENHHSSSNATITPLPVTVKHPPTIPPAALNLPCPSARDFSDVHRLCQHHEFQVVNQSRRIQGNKTLTLVAGYADTSTIVIWSHLDKITNQEPFFFLEGTLTGQQLPNGQLFESTSGSTWDTSGQALDDFGSYYLDNIPATIQELRLHLDEKNIHSFPQASASFDFTLPLHPSRVALVNQKVTANGIAITLREVKVSHVETRIDLVSTELSSAVLHENPPSNGPTYFPLTVGHLDLSYESDILNDPLYVNGRNSPMIGLELVITDPHHSLLSLHGEWTLTILPSAIPGSKVPWVFHFTVPA